MQRVALLGLGIMGSGIASNLLKKGFPLTIYNRTAGKLMPSSLRAQRQPPPRVKLRRTPMRRSVLWAMMWLPAPCGWANRAR